MRKAYTVVELLVVMAIIAVLAGILIPVLASTRKSVNKTVCASNMHQIYLAAKLYESDYGELPLGIFGKAFKAYYPTPLTCPNSKNAARPYLRWADYVYVGQAAPQDEFAVRQCRLKRGDEFPLIQDWNHVQFTIRPDDKESRYLVVRLDGSLDSVLASTVEFGTNLPCKDPTPPVSTTTSQDRTMILTKNTRNSLVVVASIAISCLSAVTMGGTTHASVPKLGTVGAKAEPAAGPSPMDPSPSVPPCSYTDNPVTAKCYHNGVLVGEYGCSDIAYQTAPPSDPNVVASCSYTFCDDNTVCSSDHTQFQQKKRTKRYYINNTGGCLQDALLIDVHDTPNGCCFCAWDTTPSDSGA